MIDMSFEVPYAACRLFWQTSEGRGIDVIVFTASAVHVLAVTL